ncbi:hypothetical protein Salat_2211200 [Sesamum alatum]|uniref:Uncharacterized protein n=1 Tax=Sesamum alatum TaxID=300844 RepID=A0AAE1XU49_9LAMI|nr:hypothetical protein Salat_2211200 [Sesamum alatum]
MNPSSISISRLLQLVDLGNFEAVPEPPSSPSLPQSTPTRKGGCGLFSGNSDGDDSAGAGVRRGAVVTVAAGGGGKSLVLSLERTINAGFGLRQLSSIDRVRHGRLLQQQPAGAGVVNFPLLLVGEDESGKKIRGGIEDCKCYLHGSRWSMQMH